MPFSTASMTPGISVKFNRLSRNACTATSLAALRMAGSSPPLRATACASARHRNLWLSGAQKSSRAVRIRSRKSTPDDEAFRPGKCVGDGRAHVRRTELGEHGAVHVFDQRVHDALSVDDDLDLLGGEAEEQTGFDQLEPLVHESGRIHRDLAAHHPVRMRTGLLRALPARAPAATNRETAPPRPSASHGARLRVPHQRDCRAAGTGRSHCARCPPG